MIYANIINKNGNPIAFDSDLDNTDGFDHKIKADLDFYKIELVAMSMQYPCAIKWTRQNDGQVAYWSPNGTVFKPYFYNKNHGNTGNKNAEKDSTQDAVLTLRLAQEKKNSYLKAAGSRKLKDWIIETLDNAAR